MSNAKANSFSGQLVAHSSQSQSQYVINKKAKKRKNKNVVNYVVSRVVDDRVEHRRRIIVVKRFDTSHMITNKLLRERMVTFTSFDRVLSSQWLDSRNVIFGTQYNKINVVNVSNRQIKSIETQKISSDTCEMSGIEAIEINSSKTLLATSGHNVSNVAVYRLPNLEPLCVAEIKHWNRLLDLKWLDDQVVVCVNGTKTLYVLALDDDNMMGYTSPSLSSSSLSSSSSSSSSKYCHIKTAVPQKLFNKGVQKSLLAIQYNGNSNELAVLTDEGKMHFFDRQLFVEKKITDLSAMFKIRIGHLLSQNMDRNLYSVGTVDSISIVDGQCHNVIKHSKILGQYCCTSLTFDNNLLTIGTNAGTVQFYDIRTMKWMQNSESDVNVLRTSDIICQPEGEKVRPIIYTIKYDYTKRRLFTAGGIRNFNDFNDLHSYGSYVGLWG